MDAREQTASRELPKCPTGILGLDEITGGGIPLLPLRRLVGDLSNEERVLLGLDLRPREADR